MTNGEYIYRKTIDFMSRMALEKDDFRRFSVTRKEFRVTGSWVATRAASRVKIIIYFSMRIYMPLFVCLIISDEFQINGLERFSIECRKAIAKNQREILKSQ